MRIEHIAALPHVAEAPQIKFKGDEEDQKLL